LPVGVCIISATRRENRQKAVAAEFLVVTGSCRRADSGAATESNAVPCEQGLISSRKSQPNESPAARWCVLRVPSFGRLLMSALLETEDLAERNRTPMRDAGL